MPDPSDSPLGSLVPGFEFLQGLAANAKSALPGIGQWLAPTLNPEELDKRINELRTVQFWLEQNARIIATTIQALEVQRMTLVALKTMNLPADALRSSMQASRPSAAAPAPTGTAGSAPAAPAVDPMQWWGSLTQQFTQLASSAMNDAMKDAGEAGRRAAAARFAAPASGTATAGSATPTAPPPSATAPRRATSAPRSVSSAPASGGRAKPRGGKGGG